MTKFARETDNMVDAIIRDIVDSKRVEDVIASIPLVGESPDERRIFIDDLFKTAFLRLANHFTSDVLNYQ